MIQLGAHGTLEWLPGKAVALSEACAPEVVLGATPVIYPFIVNNPGEAAQAKRRIGAVTIGHLTPPLIARRLAWRGARARGRCSTNLPRRRRSIRAAPARSPRSILERGARDRPARGMRRRRQAAGGGADRARRLALRPQGHADRRRAACVRPLARERWRRFAAGLELDADADETLTRARRRLRRGRVARPLARARRALRRARPRPARRRAAASTCCRPGAISSPSIRARRRPAPPGTSAAAPPRRCSRATRRTMATWPKRIVLDLWGCATMRTGGDDLAQAFALLGCRPTWDLSSNRVSGFEILPLAMLGRPRVDVTLAHLRACSATSFRARSRCSAPPSRAVAALDESADDNPLAGVKASGAGRGCSARRRAPMASGSGGASLEGDWAEPGGSRRRPICPRRSHAYDGDGDGRGGGVGVPRQRGAAPTPSFMRRTCRARTRSIPTPSPSMRAASPRPRRTLGANPALYHLDSTHAASAENAHA